MDLMFIKLCIVNINKVAEVLHVKYISEELLCITCYRNVNNYRFH